MISRIITVLAFGVLNAWATAQATYVPPPASAAIVSGIPFASAQPPNGDFHQRFAGCDQHDLCNGQPVLKNKCSTDPSRNTVLLKLEGGVIFFDGKMAIDADGSELSKTRGGTDQPQTSLRYKLPGSPSVDAAKVPYIAIPGGDFRKSLEVQLGDIAAVVYGDRVAFAIVADIGPPCKIGEGSIQLHEALVGPGHGCAKRDEKGVCIKSAKSGPNKNVLYFVFPGSNASIATGLTPDNINDRLATEGQRLWNALKGPPKQ